MSWKRMRLPYAIMAIAIGGFMAVLSKEVFSSGPTARHVTVASGLSLTLLGLVLVLLHLKAEKKY
jgi:hypothetical protein